MAEKDKPQYETMPPSEYKPDHGVYNPGYTTASGKPASEQYLEPTPYDEYDYIDPDQVEPSEASIKKDTPANPDTGSSEIESSSKENAKDQNAYMEVMP